MGKNNENIHLPHRSIIRKILNIHGQTTIDGLVHGITYKYTGLSIQLHRLARNNTYSFIDSVSVLLHK
jgi:hypothetical protein